MATRIPTIVVQYRGSEPCVKLPKSLKGKVNVKLVDEATLDIYFKHSGVTVFQTIWKDYGDSVQLSDYWVATRAGALSEDDDTFDVRDLRKHIKVSQKTLDKRYPKLVDPFHQRLAYLIDEGKLTQDGLLV